MQGVEPTACLIHPFRDEIRREVIFENLLIFKGIVPLGVGHGAAVEPDVDEVEFAAHGFAGGGKQDYFVDVRAVEVHFDLTPQPPLQ